MSLFEALAELVVYQQLTGKAASAIYARIRFAVRSFDAAHLSRARDSRLRSAGLSAGKVLALPRRTRGAGRGQARRRRALARP